MKYILLFSTLSLISCATKAPKIETCVIDQESRQAFCVLPSGIEVTREMSDLSKYVAMPYKDALNYFGYCKLK